MAVTLKQIAERADVSVTTVSRILNGRETGLPIREATRQRVLSIASELGYKPNLMARALRGSHSLLLGAIIRDISEPFLNQILKGVNSAAIARQYRVILGHVERQSSATLDYGSMFEQAHADGIIIIGDMQDDEYAVTYLSEQHQYIVGITDRTHRRRFPGVYTDNDHGISLVLHHLWELGHRRITFVTDLTINDGVARKLSYEYFMRQQGDDHLIDVHQTSRSPEGGYQVGRQIFASADRPTAIAAANDMIAIGLLEAAFQSGTRVPDEVSIVGYDDIDIARFSIPPLTTVSQSGFEMGGVAANLLLDMITRQTDAAQVQDIVMQPTLVVRQTTAPPVSAS